MCIYIYIIFLGCRSWYDVDTVGCFDTSGVTSM